MTDPADLADRAAWARDAAQWLREHERSGSVPALFSAVGLLRSALDGLPDDAEQRAQYLSLLCVATRRLHQETGDVDLLREAVSAGRASVELTPPEHDWYGRRLANFGDALVRLYERLRELDALAEAVVVLRKAAKASTGSARGIILGNVCVAERLLGVENEDGDLLAAAITAGREGLEILEPLTRPDSADLAGVWSNLGLAYRVQFQVTGDISVLHEAVKSSGTAAQLLAESDPYWPGRQHNLGVALRHLYEETSDVAVLERAVQAHRAAIGDRTGDGPFVAMCASSLSSAVYRRFQRYGDSGDLNETIDIARRAVEATPSNHRKLGVRLVTLGSALLERHVRNGNLVDLADASVVARQAILSAPSDHPGHSDALALLTNALRLESVANADASLLDDAVARARDVVAITRQNYPDLGYHLANLGSALLAKHELTGDAKFLEEAVSVYHRARLRTPKAHSRRPYRLLASGNALARAALSGDGGDGSEVGDRSNGGNGADVATRREAHAAFRAASASTAPPAIRVRAMQADARLSAGSGDWKQATRRYVSAISLLPQTAPRHLARIDREHQLSEVTGIVGEAVGAALHSGSPRKAAVLFEHGRGVILNEDFGARAGLTELRRRDSDLADEFVKVRTLLNIAETDSIDFPGAASRRQDLAERWQALVTRVRSLPEMSDFLAPLSYAELRTHALAGPLVFLNSGPYRSDALLVTADRAPLVVPLPEASPAAVRHHAARFLEAVDADPPDEAVIQTTLAWLWDAVAEPILRALKITAPSGPGATAPRLWWCPTGTVSLLPLHAAGRHLEPGQNTVMDRAVSSYAPTIRALAHARRLRPSDGASPLTKEAAGAPASVAVPGNCLVVAMPKTPNSADASDLPGALREAEAIDQLLPRRTRVLWGPEATFDSVSEQLRTTPWTHFACHAVGQPDDPSAGRLLLHDHAERPMTVADIARLGLDHAELAFLSACSTARPGTRLSDEAIHLASAFHVIGYRHVISVLWPVRDRIAVRFAKAVYGTMAGFPDTPVCLAVHDAAMELREMAREYPSVWASHLHSGA